MPSSEVQSPPPYMFIVEEDDASLFCKGKLSSFYSRENVSLVDVHSESYVFYQKARHSFFGEKMTHVNKIKCCMG